MAGRYKRWSGENSHGCGLSAGQLSNIMECSHYKFLDAITVKLTGGGVSLNLKIYIYPLLTIYSNTIYSISKSTSIPYLIPHTRPQTKTAGQCSAGRRLTWQFTWHKENLSLGKFWEARRYKAETGAGAAVFQPLVTGHHHHEGHHRRPRLRPCHRHGRSRRRGRAGAQECWGMSILLFVAATNKIENRICRNWWL